MIGIVLVTHGNLARDFIAALEHVVGPQPRVVAVCIGADDDMEKRRAEILESARACDTGDGVVAVLTDMFGGTPSNLASQSWGQARVVRYWQASNPARTGEACLSAQSANCRGR